MCCEVKTEQLLRHARPQETTSRLLDYRLAVRLQAGGERHIIHVKPICWVVPEY